jgi:hypothetical protein
MRVMTTIDPSATSTGLRGVTIIELLAGGDDPPFPLPRDCTAEGLANAGKPREIAFTFTAAASLFHAVGRSDRNGLAVTLTADLGPLPYTAESVHGRAAAFAQIAAPPSGSRVFVSRRQHVVVSGDFDIKTPVQPKAVMVELATWVVEIQPWIAEILPHLIARRSSELQAAA